MPRARKIAVATRDPVLMGMLCGIIGQSDRYIAAVSDRIDPALAARWRREADVLLVGAADLIALGREKRRRLLSFSQAAPPVVIALKSDQLLDLGGYYQHGQNLVFCDNGPDHLIEASDLALENMLIIPDAVWRSIQQRELWSGRLARMTDRERSILALLGEARSNREIAATLELPAYEVKSAVRAVVRKLGLGNRRAAGLFFRRHGGPPTSFAQNASHN